MMETFDRITRGQIALKHSDWLLLADQTLSAARLLFLALGPVKPMKLDDTKRAILFMYVCAFRAAEACFHLFSDGFAPEAYLPLRTVFEHLVDMKYVSTHPDEAARFWRYLPVGVMRHVRTTDRYLKSSPFPPEFVEGVTKEYERVKDDYRDERRWSTRNIGERAKDVALQEHYEFIYKMCSEYCHTGPMTFPKHFIEEDSYFNVPLGPTAPKDATVIGLLVPLLIQICETLNAVFDLGQLKLLECISSEFQRLTGASPSANRPRDQGIPPPAAERSFEEPSPSK